MKTYDVAVKLTIIKTYQVEAADLSEAEGIVDDHLIDEDLAKIDNFRCSTTFLGTSEVQFYVGHTKTGPSQIVTDEFRDERFYAKTGPFKTRAAAQYMIDNPMIQTVSEVEEAMKL